MRKLYAPAVLLALASLAQAHGVAGKDALFLKQSAGMHLFPFLYLGAKHMVTGYDHLLFLLGVIFFLYRLKDVAIYVTCFAVGHSITLLTGVLSGVHLNSYLVDAIIGLRHAQAFAFFTSTSTTPSLATAFSCQISTNIYHFQVYSSGE